MNTKMYVGNLSFSTSESDLRKLFSEHGPVQDVAMVMDRETGRPRGFAFISMESVGGMESAIRELGGKEFQGRQLTVNEARAQEDSPRSGGGSSRSSSGPRRDAGDGKRPSNRW